MSSDYLEIFKHALELQVTSMFIERKKTIGKTIKCFIILHSMIVEDERQHYLSSFDQKYYHQASTKHLTPLRPQQ